jgi:hypothetical protein
VLCVVSSGGEEMFAVMGDDWTGAPSRAVQG